MLSWLPLCPRDSFGRAQPTVAAAPTSPGTAPSHAAPSGSQPPALLSAAWPLPARSLEKDLKPKHLQVFIYIDKAPR